MIAARRLPFMILLGLALLMQAIVPAGWMPAHAANGIAIELCSGRMPAANDPQMQAARDLLDVALAQIPTNKDANDDEQPCVFAGLSPVAAASVTLTIPLPAAAPEANAPRSYAVNIGQGLPAPPPPSTGPPSLS